jgi:hypothetical protein
MSSAQVEAGICATTSSHQLHNSMLYTIGVAVTGWDRTDKLSVNTSVAQGRLRHKKLGKQIAGGQRLA